jgi:uncharacterized protein (DUF924 family)/uncharacterized protein YjiS (DUF1127 family)
MQSIRQVIVRLCRGFLWLAAESRRRRAIRELQAFDGRALADIGITRGEIEFAVRNGHPRQWDGDRQAQSEAGVASLAHEHAVAARSFLLNMGMAPFALLSQGPLLSAPAALSASRIVPMTENQDWRTVYDFWFPPGLEQADAERHGRMAGWWFGGGANAQLAPFAPVLEAARRGRLDHWLATPLGRLSLIIVLDQFPRGLFAGKPEAYACDPQALRIAEAGLHNGHYDALTKPWEKTFFFLPLGHTEGPDHLERLELAVAMAELVALEAPLALKPYYEFSASQARANRDVILQFGRFPHRNPVLGRVSTPAEAAYLAKGDFVHKRRPPAASPSLVPADHNLEGAVT